MTYKVDVWSGDLQQTHCECVSFESWHALSDFVQSRVDAGLLCNILDTDFIAPSDRVAETKQALLQEYLGGGN